MKLLFIGSRIQDLGGFEDNQLQDAIKKNITVNIKESMRQFPETTVLTGLNLGIETWAAEQAMSLNCPYHVYIPFDNPHMRWPSLSQRHYSYLLKGASKRFIVGTGEFSSEKMRNKEFRMIDDANCIYTVFPGPNFVSKYLAQSNKNIIDIMPVGEDNDIHISI